MNTTEDQRINGPSLLILPWKWIRAEVVITWRMTRDILLAGMVPVTLITLSASIGAGLNGVEMLDSVSKALVIGFLCTYLYDSWCQVHSRVEDARNKPYRPIPAGLVTPRSLQQRAWVATVLYILAAWLVGLPLWVLLLPFLIVVQRRWVSGRTYLWMKPVFNLAHQVIMFAIAWQLATNLDSVAWIWILSSSIYSTFALIIEDIRDLDGDRAIGRLTPVMVLGQTFVYRFFAILMVILPVLIYSVLANVSDADGWKGVLVAVIIGALSWTCAARAVFLQGHGHDADQRTYKFFCVTCALACASGPLFLA